MISLGLPTRKAVLMKEIVNKGKTEPFKNIKKYCENSERKCWNILGR